MKRLQFKGAMLCLLAMIMVVSYSHRCDAIEINTTYTGFTSSQQDVLNDSVNYWTTMLGGHTTQLNFSVDNSITALASTSVGTATLDGQNRPTQVDIVVRESGLNWTTGTPAAGQNDAMHAMSHEIGHALGWSTAFSPFNANVATTSGNRYYDLNHNGSYDAATDFDLIDLSGVGTHATDNSGDLMERFAPLGSRFEPTYQHAGVLTDAFDYDVVINGLGGTAGYGDLAMGRNDDGSSNRLNLPFEIDFYGNSYDSFFVNNNGNVTFESGLGSYTPQAFPVANQPMIAPYWGDVDTRPTNGGEVYVASPSEDAVVVTWDGVGYYSNHTDKTNDFQMVIRNRDDINAGDFDIEFRYDQLQWTTGDASGGSGGLGGTPAQAGYDAGDNTNYLSLPGSRTGAVLNLTDLTNTPSNVSIEGLWVYNVRNGTPPGTTPDNPLMPTVADDGWQFDFNIGDIEDQIFIDPLVAVGYDYFVDAGANFNSVQLPSLGDNLYDLWLWDDLSSSFLDTGTDLLGGSQYFFGAGGVDAFRILGIEPSLGLDPFDTTAFVTGLTFTDIGIVSMRQVPITFDTDAATIPLPGSLLLAGIGMSVVSSSRLRRKEGISIAVK